MLINIMNKLWHFFTSIHPLTCLILIIISMVLFYLSKWAIQKFRPQTSNQNIFAAIITIFVGFPVLGLILFFIVELLLKNQPF